MTQERLSYSQILGLIIKEEVKNRFPGSLSDFAIKSGVGHTVFFNLIGGKVLNPSARQIARIAQYLRIKPGDILDRPELLEYDFEADEKDDFEKS